MLVVMSAIEHLKEPFFKIHLFGVFEGEFNVHSLITLVGGGFIHLFGFVVEPMAKSTFYFVLAVLVVIDVVQSRYQKKLLAQRHAEMH